MVNVRDELDEYIIDGSIDWDKLLKSTKSISKGMEHSVDSDGKNINLFTEASEFISKLKGISQVSFQFIDTHDNERKRLLLKNVEIINSDIFSESVTIEKIGFDTDNMDETPMWVDKEWYMSDDDGVVFRWLGKKSYDKNSSDYNVHLFRNLVNDEIGEYDESFKDSMIRVAPQTILGKIIYKPIGEKTNDK